MQKFRIKLFFKLKVKYKFPSISEYILCIIRCLQYLNYSQKIFNIITEYLLGLISI